MSETKYTEGRLVADFENTYKDNGERHYMVGVPDTDIIVALTGKVGAGDDEESKANAERIAACWNACAGIPDEVLAAPEYSIKAELDSLDAQIAGRMKAERERDQYRARLAALEEVATGVDADIDAGRPLEYNVEHLRDELIRARAALGILPEKDAVRPREGHDVQYPGQLYNLDELRRVPELPRQCNTIPVPEDQPDWDADLREELDARKVIAFSCGFCGAPLNADKEQVDTPEGYDTNAYPHDACGRCQAERNEPRYVTREMALDAGDPSLEGTQW